VVPNKETTIAMNAIKLLTFSALFASLAAFSLAGPGPQYWAQRGQNEKLAATAPAKTEAMTAKLVKTCTSCACCGMKQ
jgi:hypothetical protein